MNEEGSSCNTGEEGEIEYILATGRVLQKPNVHRKNTNVFGQWWEDVSR